MANDELMRLAERLRLAASAPDSPRRIEGIAAELRALAQRAPQNGAMPEGMLDLVEALDAAMVESLMGEGADIWKGNRGKLRNRLPENVGAILAKMRALLAAAPAPEARQPDGYAYRYPVGQPEGVEASLLELIANRVEIMADKYDSDGMRAIAADTRRLASAPQSAGSEQQGDSAEVKS